MVRMMLLTTAARVAAAIVTCAPADAIVCGQFAGGQYRAVGEVVFQPSDGSPMFDLCSGFLITPIGFVTAGHWALEALVIHASYGGTIGAAFEPTSDPLVSTFRTAASAVVDPDFLANQLSYQT